MLASRIWSAISRRTLGSALPASCRFLENTGCQLVCDAVARGNVEGNGAHMMGMSSNVLSVRKLASTSGRDAMKTLRGGINTQRGESLLVA